jgi:hypothetical protein
MKASDLSYVVVPTEETYIEASKYNAIVKKDLEFKLMHQNSQHSPVFFEDKEARIILSPNNYSLESDEIVMEWIRKLRIDGLTRETVMLKTSFHDAFVSLFSLNSLRKMGSPNFLYYYGVIATDSNTYALSEYTFNSDYKRWRTLEDICQVQSYEVILKYYLSILLTIYQANHTCSYTHYNLTPSDIFMKPVEEKEYETEYQFRGRNLYITNGHYIPLIANHHKAYVNITLDGTSKSFGYNNIDDIPFEFKGVYCDRGFPITDAYSLLKHILKILRDSSSPAYEKFKILESFFYEISRGQEYFIPFYDKGTGPTLGDFIDFIIKNNESVVNNRISKPLLRCIGCNLEIKSNIINYYSAKTLIQLYDLINFNLVDYSKDILDSSLGQFRRLYMKESYKKEVHRFETLKETLNNHAIIYEIPDDTKLFQNKKYRDVLIKNMKSMIVYINEWEKAKTCIKVINFLADFDREYEALYEHYRSIMNINQGYYDTLVKQLRVVKQGIRKDKDIYNLFLDEVLLLETLE